MTSKFRYIFVPELYCQTFWEVTFNNRSPSDKSFLIFFLVSSTSSKDCRKSNPVDAFLDDLHHDLNKHRVWPCDQVCYWVEFVFKWTPGFFVNVLKRFSPWNVTNVTLYRKRSTFHKVWRQSSGTNCTWTSTSNILKSSPFPIERLIWFFFIVGERSIPFISLCYT